MIHNIAIKIVDSLSKYGSAQKNATYTFMGPNVSLMKP
jgi:hypothetical protein